MRKGIIGATALVILAGAAGYLGVRAAWTLVVAPANETAGGVKGGGAGAGMAGLSLESQAKQAYKSGDYAAARPLFSRWAESPEVRADTLKLKVAVAYLVDIDGRLKNGNNSVPPLNEAAVLAQAQNQAALDAMAAPSGDPPMGADRIPHKPYKSGETLVMAIKELGNFEYDPDKGGPVPADVKALDGARVKLTGFMIPTTQADKITDFAMVPSLFGCCFGAPPGVQHVITCRAPQSVEYSMDEIEVEGTIHVNVVRQDGYTVSIFEMDVTKAWVRE